MIEDTLSADTPENNKFAGILGLTIGVVSGYLSFFGEDYFRGLGIMIGVTFGGIIAGFFLYSIIKKKQFRGNVQMILRGGTAGFFIGVFISNVIKFPSIF